ncbi:hypothetical protein TNCV_1625401 [Trichonephila clavipes]|nr:hypothetical protein TNCV_1625401 [Trichonephila clavipes]
MCVHHKTTKHGCNHFDAINRTWIHLNKWRHAIRQPRRSSNANEATLSHISLHRTIDSQLRRKGIVHYLVEGRNPQLDPEDNDAAQMRTDGHPKYHSNSDI